MSRLTRDGTAEPVSRDQFFRQERGQGNIHFSCSADHEQDWQPYPVDPYSCYMCDHTRSALPAEYRSTVCTTNFVQDKHLFVAPAVIWIHSVHRTELCSAFIQYCLKKTQNAPRPSEHPPASGGKMSKRLIGWIKGCKYKTSSWYLNGFPDGNNIGSTV